MAESLVEVRIFGLVPSPSGGVGVFIGNEEKTFCIHVDHGVGTAIALLLRGERTERPLTHQLISMVFQAFEITVDRIVINDLRNDTYFARITLRADNEIHQKITEIDARPSDCLAIALELKKKIHVSPKVWNQVADISDQFEQMKDKFEQEMKDEEEDDD
jgi:bifunctional DNase/RNase